MERRDLIRALGAATAVALLPREALAAWARVASGIRPAGGLTPHGLAIVDAVADVILPRTDTPGALDVGVTRFVDVIVSENYDDAERERFSAGLAAIDIDVVANGGASFVDLPAEARGVALTRFEALTDKRAEPARTYWRLKALIVHGYFTSEVVMRDILKVQVMPGAFDGAAPFTPPTPPPPSGAAHHA